MASSARKITTEDIIPDAEFAVQRAARRSALLASKRLRRVALGPYCTFYFESFDTMLFQIQEMLLVEKGGPTQLADELAAYNPLIPNGRELVATMMFEVDEPVRRTRLLGSLGGIERHFYLQIGSDRIPAIPDDDGERTREDGKTSAVHFLRFPLGDAAIAGFLDHAKTVMLGCDDPRYSHLAVLGQDARNELARDFDADLATSKAAPPSRDRS